MGQAMKCKVAILLTVFLSACSPRAGLTFRTGSPPVVSSSLALKAEKLAGALGPVEVPALIGLLIKSEILLTYPASELDGETFVCHRETRIKDVIRAVETRMGWCYDPGTLAFYTASATHSVDEPDEFGRQRSPNPAPLVSRPILALSFRFQSQSGGVQVANGDPITGSASASGIGRTISFAVPDGVRKVWSDHVTRTYFEGVRDPASEGAITRQVETALRQVDAGITVEALAARLPGGGFRIDGQLTVASFTGSGLDQKTVTVPLQLDGPRGQWIQCFSSEGSDKSAQLGLNAFIATANVGGDNVFVLLRVD